MVQRECSEKRKELTDQQHMFCFNHASTFYTATIFRKMLINNKFEAQTLTGNPTRNSCCHALASHALSMSCSFGQSACSIESRCMVKMLYRSHFVCVIKNAIHMLTLKMTIWGHVCQKQVYMAWKSNYTPQNTVICASLSMLYIPGPWFNIKMPSYQSRKSHYGDKTVIRSSYLHNGIS